MTTKNTRIQLRRADLQATLEAINPVLLAGEPAIALDTGILKIGDGVSTYNQLPEIGASPDLSNYVTKTELQEDLEGYVESTDLATVATSGDYDDLLNKPTIPAAQVQSDWNQSDNTAVDFIKNKPTIPSTSGFVDTTTNQTIGGTKIFSESLGVQNSNGAILGISNGTYQVALGIDSNGKAGISNTNVNDWKIYTTPTDFLLDTSMLDGTTLSYDNVNNVIISNSVNKDLSNISNAGKMVAASASMPSQTTISLTLGASGTSYTMPADGWLHVTLALNINGFLGVGAVYTQSGTANGGYASVFKPVRKGETLSIAYEQMTSAVRFQFIYAKGSESEAS